jgi:ABC-type Fe3+-hydroxamate transport system substrate-binding protein
LEYFGRFGDVEAVKNKRIYVIDGDTVSRLGARIDEGVETIAGCIRPELFEE